MDVVADGAGLNKSEANRGPAQILHHQQEIRQAGKRLFGHFLMPLQCMSVMSIGLLMETLCCL